MKMDFMLKQGGRRPGALVWEMMLDINVFLFGLKETEKNHTLCVYVCAALGGMFYPFLVFCRMLPR